MSLDALSPGEVLVPCSEERLWRQMIPAIWVSEEGKPSSHAFGPSSADRGKPSFARESKVTATEALDWHNENARSPSQAVWAVSAAEVDTSGTRSVDDTSVQGFMGAPGHCYVDYRHLDKSGERVLRVSSSAWPWLVGASFESDRVGERHTRRFQRWHGPRRAVLLLDPDSPARMHPQIRTQQLRPVTTHRGRLRREVHGETGAEIEVGARAPRPSDLRRTALHGQLPPSNRHEMA